ncbi:MAG: HEAT repeat domain-containing protein [Nitrospirae bacterium]|nr:HEAT repeat domain-containing protein [Nitrospirota bacterium]
MDDALGSVLPDYDGREKDAERIKALAALARDVVMVLVKTVKATKIYLPNNPIYQKFHEELGERFGAFFEHEERLGIQVRPHELAFMGQQVYENLERDDNLALMFFRDGIREICFEKGVTPDETRGFIDILRQGSGGMELDDDLVTLLWDRDFTNITYTLTEEETEEEAAEEAALMYEIIPTSTGGEDMPGAEAGTAFAAAFRPDTDEPPAVSDAVRPTAASEAAEAVVPYIDYQAIRGTYAAPDDLALLGELAEIFHEVLLTGRDSGLSETVADSMARVVELYVRRGDLVSAAGILARVNGLADDPLAGDVRNAVELIQGRARSADVVVAAGEVIDRGESGSIEAAVSYFMQLDDRAVPELVGLLDALQDRRARKAACDVVAELCHGRGAPLLPYLSHPHWYVVRNVVMMLGMIKDPETLPAIGGAVSHPETKVRREALTALASMKAEAAVPYIEQALSDPARPIRMVAGRVLAEAAPGRAYRAFMAMVSGKDFDGLLTDEKKEIYTLLGRAGGGKALPFLAERFKKKGLLERLKGDGDRVLAAYGLAATGLPEAAELLREGAKSGSDAVRQACETGLKRTGGAGQ